MTARRRILLAVEPRILGDALADVLGHLGVDDVVLYDDADLSELDGTFDAAIVSETPGGLQVGVVITVPGPNWRTGLHLGSLFAMLDESCDAAVNRADWVSQRTIANGDTR